jgi:magnesium chelatase family protein
VRARVEQAVARQRERLAGTPWRRNAHVPAGALERVIPLGPDALDAWRGQAELRGLTGRGAARVLRVARTLADLEGAPDVLATHVLWAALLREDVP